MSETKRATIYFDPDLHRALRMKAAATQKTISSLVNEIVRQALREDHDDLHVFQAGRTNRPLHTESCSKI